MTARFPFHGYTHGYMHRSTSTGRSINQYDTKIRVPVRSSSRQLFHDTLVLVLRSCIRFKYRPRFQQSVQDPAYLTPMSNGYCSKISHLKGVGFSRLNATTFIQQHKLKLLSIQLQTIYISKLPQLHTRVVCSKAAQHAHHFSTHLTSFPSLTASNP